MFPVRLLNREQMSGRSPVVCPRRFSGVTGLFWLSACVLLVGCVQPTTGSCGTSAFQSVTITRVQAIDANGNALNARIARVFPDGHVSDTARVEEIWRFDLTLGGRSQMLVRVSAPGFQSRDVQLPLDCATYPATVRVVLEAIN